MLKTKNEDITKTAGYKETMDDVKHGRVTEYASLKDFYKEMGLWFLQARINALCAMSPARVAVESSISIVWRDEPLYLLFLYKI